MNQNRVRAYKKLVSNLIKINTEYLCRHKCNERYFTESAQCKGLPDSDIGDGWHLCFGPTIIQ